MTTLEWRETSHVPQDKREPVISWEATPRKGLTYVVAQENGSGKWCWVRYKNLVDGEGKRFAVSYGKNKIPTRQDAMDAAQADSEIE